MSRSRYAREFYEYILFDVLDYTWLLIDHNLSPDQQKEEHRKHFSTFKHKPDHGFGAYMQRWNVVPRSTAVPSSITGPSTGAWNTASPPNLRSFCSWFPAPTIPIAACSPALSHRCLPSRCFTPREHSAVDSADR